jgi:hypothetical protein
MWSRARVLLVMSDGLPTEVYVFLTPAESKAEIETLVRSWGQDEIEVNPDDSMRAGAARLELWDAEIVDQPIAQAVITREEGVVTAVHLCRDLESASSVVRDRDGGPRSGEIVRLWPMPAGDPHRRRLRWRVISENAPRATHGLALEGFHPFSARRPQIELRLVEIANLMADAGALREPVGQFSREICPRCGDHPLHTDPARDRIAPDGRRCCVACGRLDMILPGRPISGSSPEAPN